MKIYALEPISPFSKGGRGDFKKNWKKSNPESFPFIQRERIKKD